MLRGLVYKAFIKHHAAPLNTHQKLFFAPKKRQYAPTSHKKASRCSLALMPPFGRPGQSQRGAGCELGRFVSPAFFSQAKLPLHHFQRNAYQTSPPALFPASASAKAFYQAASLAGSGFCPHFQRLFLSWCRLISLPSKTLFLVLVLALTISDPGSARLPKNAHFHIPCRHRHSTLFTPAPCCLLPPTPPCLPGQLCGPQSARYSASHFVYAFGYTTVPSRNPSEAFRPLLSRHSPSPIHHPFTLFFDTLA